MKQLFCLQALRHMWAEPLEVPQWHVKTRTMSASSRGPSLASSPIAYWCF